jgi:glutamate racemase
MSEAAANVPHGIAHLFAALCCTHYAYIQDLIKERLALYTGAQVDIINPNQEMSDSVKVDQAVRRFPGVNLKAKVVSKVPLAAQNIDFITSRIKPVAPQVAQALRNYELIPKLFDV